ncbi:hexosaminidase [Paramicrobacterium humi]|uniref:beta-N-acetylhexosaminidase n=1 Tax=Paramicrobacterium humi TaxID=640635 RepID=A0A1H4IV40_9MICO|nr:family 20 glycosylhydrolase [Microbacterium humi]SEB37991.1 hexosaminidase [Microbacterium humi]
MIPVLIPRPRVVEEQGGDLFLLRRETRIVTRRPKLGEYLAGLLRPATGFALPVTAGERSEGDIVLAGGGAAGDASEAYALSADAAAVTITAEHDAGLFAGIQTLRQLLPAEIERDTVQDAAWAVPAVTVEDAPRFSYRGVMLDIARHFFDADQIIRLIDQLAAVKINHLHLHLTDDQGWRLEIPGWPELTRSGAASAVGGGPGGFLTTADFERVVRHAASRFVTIVPEVDMPGHTNAAIVAYPELAPEGYAIAPFTGMDVGFSSLSIEAEVTYRFIDEVVGHIASLTPGPYVHLGGDESFATKDEDFCRFIERATAIIAAHGKTPIGWHEIGLCRGLPAGTIGQYWSYRVPQDDAGERARSIVEQGGSLILSPADAVYLDIKPEAGYPLGLEWTGAPTPLAQVVDWDPATLVPDVGEEHILGIEAPVWTETIETSADLEAMVFPRVLGVADMAWADAATDVPRRVAALLPRLDAAGIRFGPA